jgi:hypothetical protein
LTVAAHARDACGKAINDDLLARVEEAIDHATHGVIELRELELVGYSELEHQ